MLGVGATKARDLWLEVIEGRRHPLTHGYFCTRQPDDEERSSGISSADARARELEYFRDNTPWSSSTHRDRFGVNNLVASLSNLLVRVIKDTSVFSMFSSRSRLTIFKASPICVLKRCSALTHASVNWRICLSRSALSRSLTCWIS